MRSGDDGDKAVVLSRHWARASVGRHGGSPLHLPARRPASSSFGDFISPTPRRSRLFSMILPVRVVCIYTSMCVHLSTYVPPLSSPAKVLVHLCHLLCGPTRISAIALQRVLVGQSSIPDEQPPGAMVWRRVSRHFSVGQLGRFVA